MVDFTKDFGYGLLGNNVVGGVVNGVDQIYGVMIMNDIAFHRTDQFKTVITSTYMKSCNSDMKEITLNEKFPFKAVITLADMKTHSIERKRNEM